MKPVKFLAVAMLAFGLGACAFVKLDPGAESVTVVDAPNVAHCQARGSTTVSVMDKVGFIDRNPAIVNGELATLARNVAHQSGADTVVANGPVVDGRRKFDVYKCQP